MVCDLMFAVCGLRFAVCSLRRAVCYLQPRDCVRSAATDASARACRRCRLFLTAVFHRVPTTEVCHVTMHSSLKQSALNQAPYPKSQSKPQALIPKQFPERTSNAITAGASDIHLHANGRWLYSAQRSPDPGLITVFDVAGDA